MNKQVTRPCWCGSTAATLLWSFQLADDSRVPWVRCDGCGVQALFPQPDDATLNAAYQQEYYGATRKKFVAPLAWVVDFFQSHRARMTSRLLPRGGRVLDIGCGNGEFLIRMKQRGFEVEGTEWSAQSAARIPKNSGITVHVGDLLSLHLQPRSFDLISIWHVLEHVRQPDATLRRIAELLKPGGILIMAVPNAGSRQAQRFGPHWLHHDPPRHMYGFGPDSLTQLLQRHSFHVTRTSTRSAEQNTFGYVQSVLNARGMPRDRLYNTLKTGDPADQSCIRTDLCWLVTLLFPAMVISTVEAMCGRGATLIMSATKSTTPVPGS